MVACGTAARYYRFMRREVELMIRRLEAIHPLPPGGREIIASLSAVQDLPKGGYFVRAGETPTRVGYMISGWLRYFYSDVEGREFVRYFCNGGNFVTSQAALINGEPSAFSIQALEDAVLAVFDYAAWLKLLETHTAWGIIHNKILDQALVRAESRERSLVLDDAATRYRRFLEEYPDAEEHVKQYDIASYLGVNPVTLSRIRGKN
jgi:CRP-like cAMP-binding protein